MLFLTVLQEADILTEPAEGTAEGGRVRVAGGDGGASSELRFTGSDADGYPLLSDGTAFVLRIEAFEEGAHEAAHFDLEVLWPFLHRTLPFLYLSLPFMYLSLPATAFVFSRSLPFLDLFHCLASAVHCFSTACRC